MTSGYAYKIYITELEDRSELNRKNYSHTDGLLDFRLQGEGKGRFSHLMIREK